MSDATQPKPTKTPRDSRQALRKTLYQRRQHSHAQHANALAARIVQVMSQQGWIENGQHGAAYLSFRTEALTGPLIQACHDANCELVMPRVIGEEMVFLSYDDSTPMETSHLGIKEPACQESKVVSPTDLDWMVMPLLGFDRSGNRLGYGGGYYDRALHFLNESPRATTPLLIGVAYAEQELATIPAEAWDVPLDYIITEADFIRCN